jgi:hypothetical protein
VSSVSLQDSQVGADLLIGMAALGVAAATVITPFALIIPVAVGALALLLAFPWLRLSALIIAGLLVLQTSSGLSPIKLLYLAYAALVIGLAVIDLVGSGRGRLRQNSAFLVAAIVLASFLFITLLVTLFEARSPFAWFRDALPYLLLVAAPLVGISVGRHSSVGEINRVLVVCALFGATAYALDWFSLRNVGVGIGRVGLQTLMLVAGAFSFCLSAGLQRERGSWRWLVLAGILSGALLVTGSRTGIVLFAAVLGGVPAALRQKDLGRQAARFAAAISATLIATIALALLTGVSLSFFANRVDQIFNGSNSTSFDGSAVERGEETSLALTYFRRNPLLGRGVGLNYDTVRVNGQTRANFTMDTGLLLLSKFGIAGLVVALAFAQSIRAGLRQLPFDARERIAIQGFGWVFLAALPSTLGTEDKGFAFILMVLLAAFVARETQLAKGGPQ